MARSGWIGTRKRDVLIEASRDLEYLGAIEHSFAEMGFVPRAEVIPNTVRLVLELVATGLCRLATWGKKVGTHDIIQASSEELAALVKRSRSKTEVFAFFLVTTQRGDAWVKRYQTLVDEL